MNNITPVVKNLIIINVIFFLATLFFKQQGEDLSRILGAHYFNSPDFRIWQPITYMFMHSDTNYMHIVFNMFGLYMFGSILEAHWGAKRFINFYLITGLGAIFFQWCVQGFELYQITGSIVNQGNIPLDMLADGRYNPDVFTEAEASNLMSIFFGQMVGASGAIFGIMTAFAMLYPNIEMYVMFIPVPVKAKYFIPVYILIELGLGLARIEGDSVAHFAHLGGAVIAFILVKLWRNKTNYFDYYE